MIQMVKTTVNQLWLNQELLSQKILVRKTQLEANGKVYEYAGKSEVEGVEKLTYDKTHFNDIEAPVSPEGIAQ